MYVSGLHIDGFGNVITNIPGEQLDKGASLEVNGTTVNTVYRTFTELPPGSLGLVCGSAGTIEVVGNRERAADIVGAKPGMKVSLKEEWCP